MVKCPRCGYDNLSSTAYCVNCSYVLKDSSIRKNKSEWKMGTAKKIALIIGIIAIAYIVYMWVEKDIMTIYTTMPKEQVVPLIATTIAVSLIKVAAIAGGILLIKWIISKFKNK